MFRHQISTWLVVAVFSAISAVNAYGNPIPWVLDDSLCYQPASETLSGMLMDRPYTHWEIDFRHWLKVERKQTLFEFEREPPSVRAKAKARFLFEQLSGAEPIGQVKILQSVLFPYFSLKQLEQNGFDVFLKMKLRDDGGEHPLSIPMLGVACGYGRDMVKAQIQESPLSIFRQMDELDLAVSMLVAKARLDESKTDALQSEAGKTWKQAPQYFVEYYAALLRAQRIVRLYLPLARAPKIQKRSLLPSFSRHSVDGLGSVTSLKGVTPPAFARGFEELFFAFVEREEKTLNLMLGRGDFFSRGVTEGEQRIVLGMARMLSQAEEVQQHEMLMQRWREFFLRVRYAMDRRVDSFRAELDRLLEEDYASVIDRFKAEDETDTVLNIEADEGRLKARAREYQLAIEGLYKLQHPQVLGDFFKVATLDLDRMPDWVRRKGEIPRDSTSKDRRFWYWRLPLSEALKGINELIPYLSESEVLSFHHWLEETAQRVSRQCQEQCVFGSVLESFVHEYLAALNMIFENEQAQSMLGVRADRGLAEQAYRTNGEIKWIADAYRNHTFKARVKNMGHRLKWFVQDHKTETAFMMVGLVAFALASSNPALQPLVIGFTWAMLTLWIGHMTSTAVQMILGEVDPQNRFASHGIAAGRGGSTLVDDLAFGLAAGVLFAGIPRTTSVTFRWSRLRYAYGTVQEFYPGVSFGMAPSEIQALLKAEKVSLGLSPRLQWSLQVISRAHAEETVLLSSREMLRYHIKTAREALRITLNLDMVDLARGGATPRR